MLALTPINVLMGIGLLSITVVVMIGVGVRRHDRRQRMKRDKACEDWFRKSG